MGEFNKFVQYIADIGEKLPKAAKEALKEQVDLESKEFYGNLVKTTPTDKGYLVSSLTMKKIDTPNRYGYDISYEGNAPNGEPNEKIANIVNYGTDKFAGTYFRSRAIRKLKGMDRRINLRYQKKTREEM